jgi:hypothetical protein
VGIGVVEGSYTSNCGDSRKTPPGAPPRRTVAWRDSSSRIKGLLKRSVRLVFFVVANHGKMRA